MNTSMKFFIYRGIIHTQNFVKQRISEITAGKEGLYRGVKFINQLPHKLGNSSATRLYRGVSY